MEMFIGGGTIPIKAGFVIWSVNNQHIIRTILLPLFDKYPPLTTRVTLQLQFLISAINGMSIKDYFRIRSSKYNNQSSIIPISACIPSYFPIWLPPPNEV